MAERAGGGEVTAVVARLDDDAVADPTTSTGAKPLHTLGAGRPDARLAARRDQPNSIISDESLAFVVILGLDLFVTDRTVS
jgi:hypothetical protein